MWTRWLHAVCGIAAAFVAIAVAVQAIRRGSWAPVDSAGWIPAVIVATWPGRYRRCGKPGVFRARRGTPAA